MAPDVAPIERLEEHPIAVDPAVIEEQFANVWRETAGAGFDESTIRLRVLNLVALAHTADGGARFDAVMDLLPERHPCRGILALTETARTRLDATISAHCWRSAGGRRHVCSEEVLLSGGTAQEPELASAVLALLVPELPVTTWFVGAPDDRGYLAAEMLEASDGVVFDSARAASPEEGFVFAARVRRDHAVACTDLAWVRLAAWRDLIAQLFDDQDGPRELAQITSIDIAGAAGRGGAEPMLLAGWLVSRLDLALADLDLSDERVEATLYAGSRGLRLAVVRGGDAAVSRVVIRTPDAVFAVECHTDGGHVHIREDWAIGSSSRIVAQEPTDDGTAIAAALDGQYDAAVYEDAARAALGLLGV